MVLLVPVSSLLPTLNLWPVFISGDGLPKQRGEDALGLVLNSKVGRSKRVLTTQPVPIF